MLRKKRLDSSSDYPEVRTSLVLTVWLSIHGFEDRKYQIPQRGCDRRPLSLHYLAKKHSNFSKQLKQPHRNSPRHLLECLYAHLPEPVFQSPSFLHTFLVAVHHVPPSIFQDNAAKAEHMECDHGHDYRGGQYLLSSLEQTQTILAMEIKASDPSWMQHQDEYRQSESFQEGAI